MKLHKLLFTAIAGSLFLASCSSDDDSGSKSSGVYDNGVLILNQGGFQAGNASVSYLSNDFILENDIFAGVNNALLGDTGQDIGFKGDLAYIVLNNSHKIEVVNRYNFQKVATISTGLLNPRYIAFYKGKGYVTNWGDGGSDTDDFIAVIDLNTNTVTGTIPVAEGPERIIEEDGKLYVAHSGGFGYGKTITVINASTNAVVTSIPVGDVPNSLDVEDGKLYVLSGGMPSWTTDETPGKLHIINTNNNTVAKTIDFAATNHPSNLVIEEDKIYYTVDSDIYTMALSATALPTAPLFTTTEQGVYGVSAFEVEDDHIYVGDAGDFASKGKVYIYSKTGMLHHTFTVGVAPAGFYFND